MSRITSFPKGQRFLSSGKSTLPISSGKPADLKSRLGLLCRILVSRVSIAQIRWALMRIRFRYHQDAAALSAFKDAVIQIAHAQYARSKTHREPTIFATGLRYSFGGQSGHRNLDFGHLALSLYEAKGELSITDTVRASLRKATQCRAA